MLRRSIGIPFVLLVGCTSATAEPTRCEAVPETVVERISSGVTIQGGSIRAVRAVRSADFEKVWMVAADLEGPSLAGPDPIAVWATNDLQSAGGLTFSVNAVAKESSKWGPGPGFKLTDDGVAHATACARAAIGK